MMKNKKVEANLSMVVSKTFSGLNMNALKYLPYGSVPFRELPSGACLPPLLSGSSGCLSSPKFPPGKKKYSFFSWEPWASMVSCFFI